MNQVQIAILAFIFTLIVICVAGICCLFYDAISSFIEWKRTREEANDEE